MDVNPSYNGRLLGLPRKLGAGEARRTAPLAASSRGEAPGDSRRTPLLLLLRLEV